MRIFVTGRDGQLGRALAERAATLAQGPRGSTADELAFTFAGRDSLDLLRPESFAAVVAKVAPDVIINAAAYTAVDRAEDEPDLAMAVNAAGAGRLAQAAARHGARFVQISTDYVFDGTKAGFYGELDPIDPQSAYGQSKAAGEMRVREAGERHVIVRTAWLYSPFGRNFPATMLRLARQRDVVNVVGDQVGTPTSALDLADGLIAMLNYWRDAPAMGLGRTYHLAGQGTASWADVARETFTVSRACGGPTAEVAAIPSAAYPTKAARPANSRLDSGLFHETFGYRAPQWRASLRGAVERMCGE